MKVVKGIFLFIASTLYVWLLFLSAGALETRFTFAEPTTMKNWLSESGVYGSVVDEVSKLATIQQKQENSLVQITPQDIREVAKESFPASSMQTDGEKVLDGFYDWFKGNTSSPEFSVNLSTRQAAFAKAMTDKLEVKINALPECATTGRYTVQAFDPFKADCRPKGADVTAELTSFENDLATSKDVLPQTVFSASDLKIKNKDGQQEAIASVLSWVPRAYRGVLWAPLLLGIITLASALGLIFLSTSRRKGFMRFAGGLVFVGIVMIVSGFLLGPAFDKLNSLTSKSLGAQASMTQNIINPLFTQMNKTYSRYNIIIGVAYLIPAIITYSVLLLTRTKKHEDQTNEEYVDETLTEQTEEQSRHVPATIEQSTGAIQEAPQPVIRESESPPDQPVVPQPIARPTERVVARRPPMIQG